MSINDELYDVEERCRGLF